MASMCHHHSVTLLLSCIDGEKTLFRSLYGYYRRLLSVLIHTGSLLPLSPLVSAYLAHHAAQIKLNIGDRHCINPSVCWKVRTGLARLTEWQQSYFLRKGTTLNIDVTPFHVPLHIHNVSIYAVCVRTLLYVRTAQRLREWQMQSTSAGSAQNASIFIDNEN